MSNVRKMASWAVTVIWAGAIVLTFALFFMIVAESLKTRQTSNGIISEFDKNISFAGATNVDFASGSYFEIISLDDSIRLESVASPAPLGWTRGEYYFVNAELSGSYYLVSNGRVYFKSDTPISIPRTLFYKVMMIILGIVGSISVCVFLIILNIYIQMKIDGY